MNEKLTVKVGLTTLDTPMTRKGALRWGARHMPADLKRAGFDVLVYKTDMEMHGWEGYRVSYGKKVAW